jgi:hypothetical protein
MAGALKLSVYAVGGQPAGYDRRVPACRRIASYGPVAFGRRSEHFWC